MIDNFGLSVGRSVGRSVLRSVSLRTKSSTSSKRQVVIVTGAATTTAVRLPLGEGDLSRFWMCQMSADGTAAQLGTGIWYPHIIDPFVLKNLNYQVPIVYPHA